MKRLTAFGALAAVIVLVMSSLMTPAAPDTVAGLGVDGFAMGLNGPGVPASSSRLDLSTNGTATIGNSMRIEGQLIGSDVESDMAIAGASLRYIVTAPDGAVVQGMVTTDSDGRFSVHHDVTVAGTHAFAVIFDGSGPFNASSAEIAWEATPMPELVVRSVNVVEDPYGTTVYTGTDAIQWAVNNGDTVLVAAGVHDVVGSVHMRSGTTRTRPPLTSPGAPSSWMV